MLCSIEHLATQPPQAQPIIESQPHPSSNPKADDAVQPNEPKPEQEPAPLAGCDDPVYKRARDEIEASKKRHASAIVGAGGERVILRFAKNRKDDREGTLIRAETKKNFVGHLTQRSWTRAVLAQTACMLR